MTDVNAGNLLGDDDEVIVTKTKSGFIASIETGMKYVTALDPILRKVSLFVGIAIFLHLIYSFDDILVGNTAVLVSNAAKGAILALLISYCIGGTPTALRVFGVVVVIICFLFLIIGKSPRETIDGDPEPQTAQASMSTPVPQVSFSVTLLPAGQITKKERVIIPANREIFFSSPHPFYIVQKNTTSGKGYWEELFPAGESSRSFALGGSALWFRSSTKNGGYEVTVSY